MTDELDLRILHDLMGIALDEARAAAAHDDVPVGAVVARRDGTVVARRHNERERTGDPTAHAEILALRDAADALGSWRLDDHLLVATLEPCPMCAGATLLARIPTVVLGATDPKGGAFGSLYHFGSDPRLHQPCSVVDGVRVDECAEVLRSFFAGRR